MATDYSTVNNENGGANKYLGGVSSSSVTEVYIPSWCKLVTVQNTSQAILFGYSGTEAATTMPHGFPQPVDTIVQYNPQQVSKAKRSIFLLAQTGTAHVYLVFE